MAKRAADVSGPCRFMSQGPSVGSDSATLVIGNAPGGGYGTVVRVMGVLGDRGNECIVESSAIVSALDKLPPQATTLRMHITDGFYDECELEVSGDMLLRLRQRLQPIKLQLPTMAVSPQHFYNRPAGEEPPVWQDFPRQEMAFQFFDSLSAAQRVDTKIFSYELLATGRRKFLVAGMKTFYEKYLSAPPKHRHVYEIIRDGFPCRLYFDLEFHKPSNPGVDGDALTSRWISLVVWKVQSLLGFCLGPEHVIVLDSTTADKFSKHLMLQVPSGTHYSGLGYFGLRDREVLFANYSVVGKLVEALVADITEDITLGGLNAHQQQQHQQEPQQELVNIAGRRPKPEFAEFWVRKKDGGSVCFVDLGVYTRNRAFRILFSSKYQKNVELKLAMADRRRYGGFPAGVDGSDTGLCLPMTRAAMARSLLARTFVVPYDIFADESQAASSTRKRKAAHEAAPEGERGGEDKGDGEGEGEQKGGSSANPQAVEGAEANASAAPAPYAFSYLLLDLSHVDLAIAQVDLGFEGTYRAAGASDSSLGNSRVARNAAASVSHHPRSLNLLSHSTKESRDEWKKRELECSKQLRQPSPFPPLDQYLEINHASHGGTKGHLQSWTIYGQPSAVASSSSAPSPGGCNLPGLKIRYQVANNKFCKNVQRQHKSNGIQLEVDLVLRTVTQTCWDPECRGFRSAPINIPAPVKLDPARVAHYRSDFVDRLVMLEIERGGID